MILGSIFLRNINTFILSVLLGSLAISCGSPSTKSDESQIKGIVVTCTKTNTKTAYIQGNQFNICATVNRYISNGYTCSGFDCTRPVVKRKPIWTSKH